MGLFSDLNLSIATKYGTFGMSGGKPSVSLNTAQQEQPQPAMPPAVPASAKATAVPWYKQTPIIAGIGGGVLLLAIVLLRR